MTVRALSKRPALLVNERRIRCEFASIEQTRPVIDTYHGPVAGRRTAVHTLIRLELAPREWARWITRIEALVRWRVGLRDPDRTWLQGRGIIRADASIERGRFRASIECHDPITLEVRHRGR